MLEKYLNASGKECYKGVQLSDEFCSELFHEVEDSYQLALHTNLGSITVLDRVTGFGWRDTETGFRASDGKFWLASGNCDVRDSGAKTFAEAIAYIKGKANTCTGRAT